ncbi:unnamed protein product [Owenia fusiformis]|uniref:Uncharacterized protein n=1 Tax=Owenia fusiformis TaxID=6347 RepID=A0A8J1UNM1_OWEFU|nr:unnamed protein product [Owenia fusiformis]
MDSETAKVKNRDDWQWSPQKRRLGELDYFFEEGDLVCYAKHTNTPLDGVDWLDNLNKVPEFPCSLANCNKVFDTLVSYELHYNSCHRNVCQECKRSFPSNHLLDIHLLEWHNALFDSMAKNQNMYQCLIETCTEKFNSSKSRKDHLIKVHKYPSNFRFDKPRSKSKAKKKTDKDLENMEVAQCGSCTDKPNIESMDINEPASNENTKSQPKRIFSYKVPENISFGQGISRGFHRPRGRGRGHGGKVNPKKQWYNAGKDPDMDTSVNIDEVKMDDLASALDTVEK